MIIRPQVPKSETKESDCSSTLKRREKKKEPTISKVQIFMPWGKLFSFLGSVSDNSDADLYYSAKLRTANNDYLVLWSLKSQSCKFAHV